ncbi:carbohydrate ABC transporter permease [Ruania alba]|uniref:Multiple sugar transport system permease protein n=1 Tax=Ruania alba TaxID=648782 RepID=A0A1H5D510_9MICO|nr:sugar ABC transporter permease [Ruania alba]SED73942.1 multiple sugar transport system permease protein [Ruania alba]
MSSDTVTPRRSSAGRPARSSLVRSVAGLLPTIPALVWFLLFSVGPIAALFYFALLEWRSINADRTFVGLDNFVRVIGDDVARQALVNSVVQLGVSIPIIIVGAFAFAYYLNLHPPGHRFIRTLLFTPVLLSTPALAMVFSGVFAPSGLANAVLGLVGLDAIQRPWLAEGATGLAAIIAIGIWSGLAISTVMFAARLSALPSEVFEAAELDGCSHLRRIRSIAWPMAREFVGVVTTLQFLWTLFGSAALVLLLTRGGPGNDTVTLSFLVYDYAFGRQQVGYSQAIAVGLFIIGAIGLLGIRSFFNEKSEES